MLTRINRVCSPIQSLHHTDERLLVKDMHRHAAESYSRVQYSRNSGNRKSILGQIIMHTYILMCRGGVEEEGMQWAGTDSRVIDQTVCCDCSGQMTMQLMDTYVVPRLISGVLRPVLPSPHTNGIQTHRRVVVLSTRLYSQWLWSPANRMCVVRGFIIQQLASPPVQIH